jgi:protease-4
VTTDGVGTTALNVGRSLTPEAKDILQASVENAYRTFIGHVAAAREKPIDDIDAIAQGRVWAGSDAATHGLVDKLGSFRDALNAAAARADLGDDYKIEYIEPALGWRQALAQQSQVFAARITRALVPEQGMLASARKLLSPVEVELARLARFSEPMQAYYYCACGAN